MHQLEDAGRIILFDRAGLGASDRVSDAAWPSVDDEVEHIDAVLNAAGATRVVLFALDTGAPLAALYAALRPERVVGLVIYAGAAGYTNDEARARLSLRAEGWGTDSNVALYGPSFAEDARIMKWLSSWERVTASPKIARLRIDRLARTNTTAVLPFIACPTLILHRQDDRFCAHAQSLPFAESIVGAERVLVPGADHLA